MNWLDILIIAIVAGYSVYILFSKNKRGCCGGCSGCSGNCAGCQGGACQRKK